MPKLIPNSKFPELKGLNRIEIAVHDMDLHKRNLSKLQMKVSPPRDVESTDEMSDHFVYKLYGLTENGMAIVEGSWYE